MPQKGHFFVLFLPFFRVDFFPSGRVVFFFASLFNKGRETAPLVPLTHHLFLIGWANEKGVQTWAILFAMKKNVFFFIWQYKFFKLVGADFRFWAKFAFSGYATFFRCPFFGTANSIALLAAMDHRRLRGNTLAL